MFKPWIGPGSRTRPSEQMWAKAQGVFLEELFGLNPDRVIVLGQCLWGRMPPDTDVVTSDDVQGYRWRGGVVMCRALNHPARGLSWQQLAGAIHFTYEKQFRAPMTKEVLPVPHPLPASVEV